MGQKKHYEGLTDIEVLESRSLHGSNVLTPRKKDPLWKQFLEKFEDPLIIILLIAGFLSICISFWEYWGLHNEDGAAVFFEPVGIFIAIFLATTIAFFFELKADKEFAILNQVNELPHRSILCLCIFSKLTQSCFQSIKDSAKYRPCFLPFNAIRKFTKS